VKKNIEKDHLKKSFQTPPSKEKENSDFPLKNTSFSKDPSLRPKEIDQNLKRENDFLKNDFASLLAEHKLLQDVNMQLNQHVVELNDSFKKLNEKYNEKKAYIRKLLDVLKSQGIISYF